MKVYEWNGTEEPLGTTFITTRHMTVEELKIEGTSLSAKGSIKVHDHVEGFEGDDPWVATGTLSQDATPTQRWTVRRYVGPDDFAFRSKDGEPLFGLIDVTNQAIKAFIAAKLVMLVDYGRKNPGKPIDLVDEVARYAGPKSRYRGPCICDSLTLSTRSNPFNWDRNTDGGKYPANCFRCSCGTSWYRINPAEAQWVQVGDPEAWDMLTEFNGVAVEHIAIDPQSQKVQLVLERTLRKRGLIPIG